ncbi:MAG: hypothetical protein LQ350_006468 [Teloschistes chrysophthalmus]|nr:MAG: hypothetical protein LQ350_006468 [Niorma chrysophthalma]
MGVSFEAQPSSSPAGRTDNNPRPRSLRPNYNKIHAQPLPIKTYPLPILIPHNPLSLIQIAFTYLSQLLAPPSSYPQPLFRGYFSAETRSIHVTDETTARALWEQGFFGKGSLSRSEPAWLEREKIRQGIVVGDTSEEVTRRRREERKQFKNERAKKEREAIEEKLAEELQGGSFNSVTEDGLRRLETQPSPNNAPMDTIALDNTETMAPSVDSIISSSMPPPEDEGQDTSAALGEFDDASISLLRSSGLSPKVIINQEHLQLNFEEAFFLVYGLGVLEVQAASNSERISTSLLFSLNCSHSHFPPEATTYLQPDEPFILSYVVYHHFRSLGWVVRPGIKFAVDYLLYNRGPVFSHAEFAVIIVPAFSDPYWSSTKALQAKADGKQKKTWWWIHCVNRVQTQVRKTLVVAFVEVPPPADAESGMFSESGEIRHVGRFLKRYRVREVILKRWTPNRSRG